MARWDMLGGSGNVEDRRGSGGLLAGGGGLISIVLVIAFAVLGNNGQVDVDGILQQLQQSQVQTTDSGVFAGADDYEVFASKVLGSNNQVWRAIMQQSQQQYTDPKLVLFRSATQSGCGIATSDVGPHYCPADSTIYLDETFFEELQQRFRAKGGDVAEAYVISHEVGHHVQNQLGIMRRVQEQGNTNQLSVTLELQADCFAGVWAHSVASQGVFETGEINEALDAAAAVGDDRIQQSAGESVNPETWTHGSAQQRTASFNAGYVSGDPASCDFFK